MSIYLSYRFLDGEKLYITVANVGPFVEKVNLNAIGITIPDTLSYHIVSVSSLHQIKYVLDFSMFRWNSNTSSCIPTAKKFQVTTLFFNPESLSF